MAQIYKVLGQSFPTLGTLTDAYIVPTATSAIVSSIVVHNEGMIDTVFKIAIAVAGAANDAKQYLFSGAKISQNQTHTFTLGVTLAETDVIRVESATGDVAFNIFGTQITN